MSRLLKTSGFLGLTVQMLWGMGNVAMLIGDAPSYFDEIIGAHAHFGVLGILAVVTGFAVEQYGVSGTRRTMAVHGFIAGQWLLPATILLQGATGVDQLGLFAFVWGLGLLAAMAVMASEAWNAPEGASL